jgi:hypothetical protein
MSKSEKVEKEERGFLHLESFPSPTTLVKLRGIIAEINEIQGLMLMR